ncbi:hypothetical protein NMY22_g7196 [Coprinellus aureogranulatus]|nr:hypothetical protein NMY22_g7196 [Coprinellus aureogranulatus]
MPSVVARTCDAYPEPYPAILPGALPCDPTLEPYPGNFDPTLSPGKEPITLVLKFWGIQSARLNAGL